MNLYEDIKKLCTLKGISIVSLENAAHLSNGSISKWKSKMPNAYNLYKVSQILGKSMESILLSDTIKLIDTANSEYSSEDNQLITFFHQLDDCERQIILGKISELLYNKQHDIICFNKPIA